MLMGIGDQGALSPTERRSELRKRRLELLSMGDDSSSNQTRKRTTPSPSGQIGERSRTTTDDESSMSDPSTVSADSPLMSEVNAGTKRRAEERGFGS
jgi:hypothetical protein